MSSFTQNPAAPPAPLLRAVRQVLGPLVRMLIKHQVTFPMLAALLKRVYVEQARQVAADDGCVPSDSRVHLLTGVHRKDIRRLREPDEEEGVPPAVSLAGQVIARWTADEAYAGEDGQARPLPIKSTTGVADFECLVAEVCRQDVRARAVLDELQNLGVVETDGKVVRLRMEAFVPNSGLEEKCYYLGRNVHDHLAAAARNVEGGHDPFPECSVYYGELSADSVETLREAARDGGMQALQDVNRRALALKRVSGPANEPHRINFGFYFFSDRTPHAEETP